MQHIPADVCMQDVWQWLGHGWFFYDEAGVYEPAYITSVNDECEITLVDGSIRPWRRQKCFPHWPDCGAVNVETTYGFAVIVERRQSRQYRRTYNQRCLTLNIPRKWDVMKRSPMVTSLTPNSEEVVRAVFSPSYYSYDRALTLLDEGWVSVALNQHLIIAGERDEHLIYYRGKLIARVSRSVLEPLDDNNPRNLRILKWFDGRVRCETIRRGE
jgi:hypothetical protein